MKKLFFLSSLFVAICTMNAVAAGTALTFGHCDRYAEFVKPYANQHFPKGKMVYVKVHPKDKHDVKYMKLYVDGQFVRTEKQYPYEWGKSGDYKLKNLSPGKHILKCRVYYYCGSPKEYQRCIYIDGNGGGGGGQQPCFFNNPFEMSWCQPFKSGYEVCVVIKHGIKYIKIKKCGSNYWKWYNCYGKQISPIHGCAIVKCYDYCHNDGGHANCNYKGNIYYQVKFKHGWGYYLCVEFKPYDKHDIQWVELWLGHNNKVRRENSYPFEWAPYRGDHDLKHLQPGKTYKLKCKIYTKCGQIKSVERYVTIGGGAG